LLPLEAADGKLDPQAVRRAVDRGHGVHTHKPGVLSLTQATEAGTVYTPEELRALTATARELGLRVHMDGARLANALAELGVPARALTWEAGVDVLALGGTKDGLAAGDAVVFFDRELARDFDYRRKQAGHLLAKMRFVSAPWVGVLESGAWLRNARHANAMARLLEEGLRSLPGVRVVYPVQANGVFVELPPGWAEALHRRGWFFYTIAGAERLVCSWDTQPGDITAFLRDLQALAAGPGAPQDT
jgi:threonine aldolase